MSFASLLKSKRGACPYCKGDGKCVDCSGTGVNTHVNEDDPKCASCAGSGICPNCAGSGTGYQASDGDTIELGLNNE